MSELRHDFDEFKSNDKEDKINELGEKDLNGYSLQELEDEFNQLTDDLASRTGKFMESTQTMKEAPKRINHLKNEIEKRERIAEAFAKQNEVQELDGREN